MKTIRQLAMDAMMGGSLIGAAVDTANMINSNSQNRKQYHRQKKLMDHQMENQLKMNQANMAMNLEYWDKTNYDAQVKQMQKAGLNPGLMYESGGPGGISGNASGSAASGNAPSGRYDMGMGMQLGLQAAQAKANIELTKAQTEKTQVEKDKMAGADTAQTQQSTAESAARTEHEQIKMRISQAEEKAASASVDARIEAANAEAAKMEQEVRTAKAEADVNQASKEQRIEAIRLANIETQIEMVATKAGIRNTEQNTQTQQAAVKKMASEMLALARENQQKWQQLSQQDKEIWIKEQVMELMRRQTDFNTGGMAETKRFTEMLSDIMKGIGAVK